MPDHFRADLKLTYITKGIFQTLLNTDNIGAYSSTTLEILFHSLATFLVKKFFLMSSLNLPWHGFEPFSRVLSLNPREKGSHLPLDFPSRGKNTLT